MAQDINICGGCGEYDYECQCLINKNRGGSQGVAPVEITCSDWVDAREKAVPQIMERIRKWSNREIDTATLERGIRKTIMHLPLQGGSASTKSSVIARPMDDLSRKPEVGRQEMPEHAHSSDSLERLVRRLEHELNQNEEAKREAFAAGDMEKYRIAQGKHAGLMTALEMAVEESANDGGLRSQEAGKTGAKEL